MQLISEVKSFSSLLLQIMEILSTPPAKWSEDSLEFLLSTFLHSSTLNLSLNKEKLYKDIFGTLQFLQFLSLLGEDLLDSLTHFLRDYFGKTLNEKTNPSHLPLESFLQPLCPISLVEEESVDVILIRSFLLMYREPEQNFLTRFSFLCSPSPPVTFTLLSYLESRAIILQANLCLSLNEAKKEEVTGPFLGFLSLIEFTVREAKANLSALKRGYDLDEQKESFFNMLDESFISLDPEDLLSPSLWPRILELMRTESLKQEQRWQLNSEGITCRFRLLSLTEEFLLVLANLKKLLELTLVAEVRVSKNLCSSSTSSSALFPPFSSFTSPEDAHSFSKTYITKRESFRNNSELGGDWEELNLLMTTLYSFLDFVKKDSVTLSSSLTDYIFRLPSYKTLNLHFEEFLMSSLFIYIENSLSIAIDRAFLNLKSYMFEAKPKWKTLSEFILVIYRRIDPTFNEEVEEESFLKIPAQIPPLSLFIDTCRRAYSSSIYDFKLMDRVDEVIRSTCQYYEQVLVMDHSFSDYSFRKLSRLKLVYHSIPTLDYEKEDEEIKLPMDSFNLSLQTLATCRLEDTYLEDKKRLLKLFELIRKLEEIIRDGFYDMNKESVKSANSVEELIKEDERIKSLKDFISEDKKGRILIPLFSLTKIRDLYFTYFKLLDFIKRYNFYKPVFFIWKNLEKPISVFLYLSFSYFLMSSTSKTTAINSFNSKTLSENNSLPEQSKRFYNTIKTFEEYFRVNNFAYNFSIELDILYEIEATVDAYSEKLIGDNQEEFLNFPDYVYKLGLSIDEKMNEKDKEKICVLLNNSKIKHEIQIEVDWRTMMNKVKKEITTSGVTVQQIYAYYKKVIDFNEDDLCLDLSSLLHFKLNIISEVKNFLNLSSEVLKKVTNFQLISLMNPTYLGLIDILKLYLLLQTVDAFDAIMDTEKKEESDGLDSFFSLDSNNESNSLGMLGSIEIQKNLINSISDYKEKISISNINNLINCIREFPFTSLESSYFSYTHQNSIQNIPFFHRCIELSTLLFSFQNIIEIWQNDLRHEFALFSSSTIFDSSITDVLTFESIGFIKSLDPDLFSKAQTHFNDVDNLEIKLFGEKRKRINDIQSNNNSFSSLSTLLEYFQSASTLKVNLINLMSYFKYNKISKKFSNFFLSEYHPLIFKLVLHHYFISEIFKSISLKLNYFSIHNSTSLPSLFLADLFYIYSNPSASDSLINYKFSVIDDINQLFKLPNIDITKPIIINKIFNLLKEINQVILSLPFYSIETFSIVCSIDTFLLVLHIAVLSSNKSFQTSLSSSLLTLIKINTFISDDSIETLVPFLEQSLPFFSYISTSFFNMDLMNKEINHSTFISNNSSLLVKFIIAKPLFSLSLSPYLIFYLLSSCPSHLTLPSFQTCSVCRSNLLQFSLSFSLIHKYYNSSETKLLSQDDVKELINNLSYVKTSDSLRNKVIKVLKENLDSISETYKKKQIEKYSFFPHECILLSAKIEEIFYLKYIKNCKSNDEYNKLKSSSIIDESPSIEELAIYKSNCQNLVNKLRQGEYLDYLNDILDDEFDFKHFFSHIILSKPSMEQVENKRKRVEENKNDLENKKSNYKKNFLEPKTQNSLEIERKVKLAAEKNEETFFKDYLSGITSSSSTLTPARKPQGMREFNYYTTRRG